jgi:glycosyltransferase involved in cell wall biosynthesis
VQLIHNAKQNLTGKNSDSFWKRIPSVYSWLEKLSLQGARSVGVFNLEESLRLSDKNIGLLRCRTWFDQTHFNTERSSDSPEDNRYKILWVGRLDEQKDPVRAVRVFSELLSMLPQAELHIFGEGPLRQKTAALCQTLKLDSVFFHGSVPKDNLANHYKSGSALLMTSHYEGSPTVLVEALACGLPAVVNADSDPDGLIKNGVNGIRLREIQEKEMAGAVLECISLDSPSVARSVEDRSAQSLCLKTLIAIHSKL